MTDTIKAHIRTFWPILLGALAALLVKYAAEKVGVQISSELALVLVTGATAYAIYAIGSWLEHRRWAPARVVGRLLLSVGADLGKPTYPTPPDPSVTVLRRSMQRDPL